MFCVGTLEPGGGVVLVLPNNLVFGVFLCFCIIFIVFIKGNSVLVCAQLVFVARYTLVLFPMIVDLPVSSADNDSMTKNYEM